MGKDKGIEGQLEIVLEKLVSKHNRQSLALILSFFHVCVEDGKTLKFYGVEAGKCYEPRRYVT